MARAGFLAAFVVASFLAAPLLAAVPAGALEGLAFHGPKLGDKKGTSTNWAGYAVQTDLANPAAGAVTDVRGTWVVPAVTCPGGGTNTYSAAWVGIDGYSSSSVEQTGTESDCLNGGATPSYAAWWEMYPKPSRRIAMTVHAGDTMSAEVFYKGNGNFVLTLSDLSTGASFTTTQKSGKAARSSAEWIQEAPWSGGVLPLADFGAMSFSASAATLSGHAGGIADAAWQADAITMVNGAGQVKCATSALSGGDAFTETFARST